MTEAEAMEHGMGGGDPDYDPEPSRDYDIRECDRCGIEWDRDQMFWSKNNEDLIGECCDDLAQPEWKGAVSKLEMRLDD